MPELIPFTRPVPSEDKVRASEVDQKPPEDKVDNTIEEPTQTEEAPVIGSKTTIPFTEIEKFVTIKNKSVYEIVHEPSAIAIISPVFISTVQIEGSELNHVPPGFGLTKISVFPSQIEILCAFEKINEKVKKINKIVFEIKAKNDFLKNLISFYMRF